MDFEVHTFWSTKCEVASFLPVVCLWSHLSLKSTYA